ncbi:hypothetical protein HDU96_006001 [Phlyctochytrium bullatum]|nr:hypothetical protein HDU96_006001 [Phlyctochytrium bullatum]
MSRPPPTPLERLPVEVARSITIHLHPEWLPSLLSTSRLLRRLFAPGENELAFARKHLRHQFGEVSTICENLDWETSSSLAMVADVPFRKLPVVYGVAWIVSCWDCIADSSKKFDVGNAMDCMMLAFSDLDLWSHGPRLPVAWTEKIMLKALESVPIKLVQEGELAVGLASLLDSVAIVEIALWRLFPNEMKSQRSADAGASEIVAAAGLDWLDDNKLRANDKRHSLAWFMAMVAEEASEKGAVHLLVYALQHPVVPVGFSFSRPIRYDDPDVEDSLDFLIDNASKEAHMHLVHYLLGNPLPLTPPPASRPIRPGHVSAGLDQQDLKPSYETRLHTESVLFSRENPVARLTYAGFDKEPPLQNLLNFRDHDPVLAATYLLDHGAPPNSSTQASTSPLHLAALHGCSGLVRLLVKHGANVDDERDGRTPLHYAAQQNHVACALELLECGADRDAIVQDLAREPPLAENVLVRDLFRRRFRTPLKLALENQSTDVARVLLRAGATLLVRGKHGDEHIDEKLRNQLLGLA